MADVAMESEGKAAGGRVTCSCGGGTIGLGAIFFVCPCCTRLLTATMRFACDRMRSRKKTFLSRLSKFLKMHREQEAGQKVCLKCFFTTTVNRFHNFFRLSQKGRNEKRDSFYTAKSVSSVHSCRDETRLAVFSVPFPQNKFRTCFFL